MPRIECTLTIEDIDAALAVIPRGKLRRALIDARVSGEDEARLLFDDVAGVVSVTIDGVLMGKAKQYAYADGRAYWQIYMLGTRERLRASAWPALRRKIVEHLRIHGWRV